ncbi:PAS domain-containing protein [Cystobacter fuscus]|uniref:sensor histidine kinase n=1 Tax=Cystobacter fuscus TaxID=43 RepID=UPI002B2B2219|nr:PAS domain-containing protein [Cystobacter fuscus]
MPSLAELIERNRESLLLRYREEASRLPSAREVRPEDVIDNLPEYLATLRAPSRDQHGDPGYTRRCLEEAHLRRRLRLGYTQEDVKAEFALLGRLLSGLWTSLPPSQQPPLEDTQRLADWLRAAMEHTESVFGERSPDRIPPGLGVPQLREAHFRLAIEATGLGTWDYDPVTGVVHADERCLHLLGLPPDATLDYAVHLSALHPEDRERVHHVVQQSLSPAGSGSHQLEFRTVGLRDGIERWLSANGRALFDENGRAVRLVGTVLDITERVREREATERERQRLKAILESMSEAFLSFDREWRFTYVNREAERFMGMSREQVLGRGHWEVFPATLGTNVERYYRRVAAERIPLSFENFYAPWQRWFEFHVYPIDEGIASFCQDITERKHREEEREQFLHEQTRLREQAEQALLQSQRAAEVLEHGDPFLLLDRDFRIIQVNKNQELISQKRREEELGRVLWDVFPAINNPESAYWREYHRAMNERVPVQFEEYYPPLELWASVSAYPTAEGGLAVFLRDVTERKHAEQFRERLMGIVSHDLRSPLHAITLAAETLLRREHLSESVLARVRRIVQSGERMSRMITDLLDFTRARMGGGIPLQRRPGELVEWVRTTLEEFEVTHPGRIVFSHGQGPYTGEWDLDRLAQVISNLVGNALKHGAENTPVEVDLREEGQEIVLVVTNQGTPIPESLLPHVFDPFRRSTDSPRQGLGLGLYIAQQIVLAHGGSITASSSPAAGTTFSVRLPRGPVPS